MRRKSTRNTAKASPEKTKEEKSPKKSTRRHSRRYKQSSSESESEDEIQSKKVETMVEESSNNSEGETEKVWTVTPAETQSPNDIQKIKICLTRPSPATPERTSKRVRSKPNYQVDDDSPPEEKTTRRSRRRGAASPKKEEQDVEEKKGKGKSKGKHKSKLEQTSQISESEMKCEISENVQVTAQSPHIDNVDNTDVDNVDHDLKPVEDESIAEEANSSIDNKDDDIIEQQIEKPQESEDDNEKVDSTSNDCLISSNVISIDSNVVENQQSEVDTNVSDVQSQTIEKSEATNDDSVKDLPTDSTEQTTIAEEESVKTEPSVEQEIKPDQINMETVVIKKEDTDSVITKDEPAALIESVDKTDENVVKTECEKSQDSEVTEVVEQKVVKQEEEPVVSIDEKVKDMPVTEFMEDIKNDDIKEDAKDEIDATVEVKGEDTNDEVKDEDTKDDVKEEDTKDEVKEEDTKDEVVPTPVEESTTEQPQDDSNSASPKPLNEIKDEDSRSTDDVEMKVVEEIKEQADDSKDVVPNEPEEQQQEEVKTETNIVAIEVEKPLEEVELKVQNEIIKDDKDEIQVVQENEPIVETPTNSEVQESSDLNNDDSAIEQSKPVESCVDNKDAQKIDEAKTDTVPEKVEIRVSRKIVLKLTDTESDKTEIDAESNETTANQVRRNWGRSNNFVSGVEITTETITAWHPDIKLLAEQEVKLETSQRERLVSEKSEKQERKISIDEKRTIDEPISVTTPTVENVIAFNRKISIVNDDASNLRPPPSPAKNEKSDVLFITNLVRPFTVKQLRELLERTGSIVDDGFWTDKIKSKCYVHYQSAEEAEATRNALHGVQWPIGNGKKLIIDYSSQDELDKAKNPPPIQPSVTVTEQIGKENEEPSAKKLRTDVENKNQTEAKNNFTAESREGERRSRSRSRNDKRRFSRSHHSRSPSHDAQAKKTKKEESVPQRAMDDLFRKTEATPCIYWQPLSDEEIALKQQLRLERMAEHKRRMESQTRNRRGSDYTRGGPYRRRY